MLIQIEAHLRSIRHMMIFFVVITVLSLLLGGFGVVSIVHAANGNNFGF